MDKPNLRIKYSWDERKLDGIELDSLGESIVGFHFVIKELARVLEIQGEISVKTQIAKHGSINFDIYVQVDQAVSQIPFNEIRAYADFLLLSGRQICAEGLDVAKSAHQALNEFYQKNPFDATLIGYALVELVKFAKKQKRRPDIEDENKRNLPKKYAIKLHKLITKKRIFRKALRPFVDDQVSTIEIMSIQNTNYSASINSENFEDYLSEDEQILPQYLDGKTYKFHGVIVGLESAHGDYLKFKVHGIKREHSLLIAHPENQSKTEDYIAYYKKEVLIEAKVIRKSLYQKPKLQIKKIDLMQKPLL